MLDSDDDFDAKRMDVFFSSDIEKHSHFIKHPFFHCVLSYPLCLFST